MTIIYLDAGHGPSTTNPGGGSNSLFTEAAYCLEMAQVMQSMWPSALRLTRETDKSMSHYQRTAATKDANFVLSLHTDYCPYSKQTGARIFYYPGSVVGQQVANLLYDNHPEQLKNRFSKPQAVILDPNHRDYGWQVGARKIVSGHRPPTVLIELGFSGSSVEEAVLLKTMRQEIAESLVHTLRQAAVKYLP